MLTRLVAAAAMSVVLASPAAAEDQRPCVSKVEFDGFHGDYTRAEVGDRWEVAGHGAVTDRGPYRFEVTYPACGYGSDEAGVVVSYRKSDSLAMLVGRWKIEGSTLHGRP